MAHGSSCCVLDLGFSTRLSESGTEGCHGVIRRGDFSLSLSLRAGEGPLLGLKDSSQALRAFQSSLTQRMQVGNRGL